MECPGDCVSRIVSVSAKCSDEAVVRIGRKAHEGYVPSDLGIGGGDYIEFKFCLDCGRIEGSFPLPKTELERAE